MGHFIRDSLWSLYSDCFVLPGAMMAFFFSLRRSMFEFTLAGQRHLSALLVFNSLMSNHIFFSPLLKPMLTKALFLVGICG